MTILDQGDLMPLVSGLPKIHKPGFPLRPIVSAVGSYTHQLAKYLADILKLLANISFTVKDSFSFTHELLSITNIPFTCSFDVVSLFTNIPVDKAIDIYLKKLYKDTDKVDNFTCEQFKELLKYCVKQIHFQFEDKYFDQRERWSGYGVSCIGDMWTTSF